MKKQVLWIPILLLLLFAIGFFFWNGGIVFDHSAVATANGFTWKGETYLECPDSTLPDYSEGRTLARTPNGWDINAVKEDPEHHFLVKRSLLDQYLCVREGYLPSDGQPDPTDGDANTAKPPEPQEPLAPPANEEELVLISDYIPTIFVDLKYATTDNFTGKVIYDFEEPKLRYCTVKKLKEVQDALLEQGYSLLIWDAFRPVSAQFKLWEICPDATFVANPNKGHSSHSRGNTVDITIVTKDGKPVEMPTGFDDFTALADRDYSDVTGPALEHVKLLEDTMTAHGFKGYSKEWWHFSDTNKYAVIEDAA